MDYTLGDADHHARLLTGRFPDAEEWQQAKRTALGVERGGRRVSATVDWFIATQAKGRGWLLVTDDRGGELELADVVRSEELREVLLELLAGA